MADKQQKKSYTINCGSGFRDSVMALAEAKGVNVADLARSVVLLVPSDVIDAFPDPGDPKGDDRETVILKSGPSAGRPWQRKPRMQVRMGQNVEPVMIRRALGIALHMARGEASINVDAPGILPEHVDHKAIEQVEALETQVVRLKDVIATLSFEPLANGVSSKGEALHILGFSPGRNPDEGTIRARYRTMAGIHHPDSGYGNHKRMSQINEAMEVLRRS